MYRYGMYRQVPNLSFVAIIWIIFSRSPNVHLITAYLFIFFHVSIGNPVYRTGIPVLIPGTVVPVPYRTGTTYRTGIVRTVYRRVVYK